jgi:hypothetical protein
VSAFTIAYLVRLGAWWLVIAAFQGVLVLLSWLAWERVTTRASVALRHRLACLHLAALAILPAMTMGILHWTVAGMGVPASHGSPIAELPALMAAYRAAFRLALSLAMLWLAGVCLMVLRLVLDLWRMTRLYRSPAPAG